MTIETDRLILREMTEEDYDALYAVLADSDIMQHYPYTFDETRVRGWIAQNIERYKTFGFGPRSEIGHSRIHPSMRFIRI